MSEFKVPLQIGNSVMLEGGPRNITKIGKPEVYPEGAKAFVPVQLDDGSYRILYCSAEGVERIIASHLPQIADIIRNSRAMPTIARGGFRTYVSVIDASGCKREITLMDDIRRDEYEDEDRISP